VKLVTEDFVRHLMIDFTQMKAFADDPLVIDEGDGIRFTDDRGRTYLDGLSGVFTNSLGHGNHEVIAAMTAQAQRVAFVMPTLGTNTRAVELVERYRAILPAANSMMKFLSGGSEANESALKLARQYHKQTGHPIKYKVVSHYRGYHGGTGHALAASGWAGWKDPYEPFATGFVHLQTPDPDDPPVPLDSAAAVADLYVELARRTIELEGPDTIAAIITEPILMSAGIVVPPDAYLRAAGPVRRAPHPAHLRRDHHRLRSHRPLVRRRAQRRLARYLHLRPSRLAAHHSRRSSCVTTLQRHSGPSRRRGDSSSAATPTAPTRSRAPRPWLRSTTCRTTTWWATRRAWATTWRPGLGAGQYTPERRAEPGSGPAPGAGVEP
jgi:hypothetical protein